MEPQLLGSVTDGVATVVVHHPAKRNAMTAQMWRALPPLLARLAADPRVRALVLTGEGGTFCAGADISSLRASADAAATGGAATGGAATGAMEPEAGTKAGTGTDTEAEAGPQTLAVRAEEALAAFPRPTLAVVRGHCVGGGCQLAAACDLRFAAADALFGVTPAKLGIVYPSSSTRRLVSLVGPATAKYLLFSGELIGADRALRTGLVDEVHAADELDKRVTELTGVLVSRSALTQAAAKEFAAGREDRDAHWAVRARESGDRAEGIAAFLERRSPRFGPPPVA